MSAPKEDDKKSVKRLSLVALVFAATVFGLIIGLGGSMLLTHSLIQQPLLEQQARINQQHVLHQQEMALLHQGIAQQNETIAQLKNEIHYVIMADSNGYLKELAGIQKESQNRELELLQEINQLKAQTERLNYINQEISHSFEKSKNDLDRSDQILREDLRLMQSSLNDLKNQLDQLERQLASR